MRTASLNSGKTQSCGCYHRERIEGASVTAHTKHGQADTREYMAWVSMRKRCYDPKYHRYDRYGGRGIKVCERWLNSVEDFIADMGPQPAPHSSIDRIDNDADYTPENCRWATKKDQANNRSSSRFVTILGETKTLAQWVEQSGLPYNTLLNRIASGRPESELLLPGRARRRTTN